MAGAAADVFRPMSSRNADLAGYEITTDASRFDLEVIHRYLSDESYWAKGIPRKVVERSIRNSLGFAILERTSQAQVGFARVTTDRATFAYLGDVFVLPAHRGRGLSKWLMQVILAHEDLQGLRRWMLATLDAHGLYAGFGFTPLAQPERFMLRYQADVYTKKPPADELAGGA
jgi:N-acetylglutamate synthase-like GNAT family acetyltransferase